jgi:WD40 repeat protein
MRLSLKTGLAVLAILSAIFIGQGDAAPYQLPAGAELVPQITHEGRRVTTIALSPDNAIAVVGGHDRRLQFWDLSKGKLLRSVEAYDKGVFSLDIVVFSPNGRFVLTAPDLESKQEGDSRKVKLWDVATGALARAYDVEFPAALAFSADGRSFLAGGSAGLLTLRDIDTGAVLKRYEDRKAWAENAVAVAMTQDGKMVICVGSDGTIRRWNAESGEQLENFGVRGFVRSVRFTSDVRFVFVSEEGHSELWDVKAGVGTQSFDFGWGVLEESIIAPDLSAILKIRWDGAATISDSASGRILKNLGGGHVWDGDFDFSTRGSYVLLLGPGGALELWNYATGTLVHSTAGPETHVDNLIFSASGGSFFGRCAASVCEWDIARGGLIRKFQEERFSLAPVAVSTSGNRIVLSALPDVVPTRSGKGFVAVGLPTLELWDSAAGKRISALGRFENADPKRNHFAPFALASFSPNGQSLLSASAFTVALAGDFFHVYGSRFEFRDAATGELTAHHGPEKQAAAAIAFSPQGKTYVSASTNGEVSEWPSNGAEAPRPFFAGLPRALFVSYSADGERVWAINRDGQLRSWDARGIEAATTFDGLGNSIVAAATTPDRRAVLLAYADDSLKLWNVETGQLIRPFEGRRDKVKSLSVSPDGRRALSTNSDNTADLWDVDSGKLVATWFFVDDQGVALTPDGRFVTQADPNRAFAIVRGLEFLPIDEFVAKDRIDALPDTATTQIAPSTP